MKTLLSFLEDNSGGISSMRVVMFLVIGQIVFSKIAVQIATQEPQPWTYEEIGVVLAVLGCKSHQRGKEQPAAPISQPA